MCPFQHNFGPKFVVTGNLVCLVIKSYPKESIWPRGMFRNEKRNMRILILDWLQCSWKFLKCWVYWFCICPQIFRSLAPFVSELWLPKEIEDTFYVPTKITCPCMLYWQHVLVLRVQFIILNNLMNFLNLWLYIIYVCL